VQDALIRLDRTVGKLLTMLDETVGSDRYTLALSADHGVGFIPEALLQQGQDAGRVLNAVVRKNAEAAMVAAHGPGPHVAHVEYTEVYLTDQTRKMVAAKPDALEPLLAALARVPGIMRAIPTRDLPNRKSSGEPAERAAAHGHYPGVSGDVQVILKPNWIGTDTSAATHGTFQPYDQQVPVIFLGDGIHAGRYLDAATPADIAPTLASLIELALPGIDGKTLKSALR
jgi:arylsulfatase A-like enzyme